MEKAALIGLVTLRYIECDENFSMRGEKLLKVIKQDRDKGLIPFWVSNEMIFYTSIHYISYAENVFLKAIG